MEKVPLKRGGQNRKSMTDSKRNHRCQSLASVAAVLDTRTQKSTCRSLHDLGHRPCREH